MQLEQVHVNRQSGIVTTGALSSASLILGSETQEIL